MTAVLVSQTAIEALTVSSTPPRVISSYTIELVTTPLITPRAAAGIYIEVLTPAPLIDFAGWGAPITS